MRASRASVIGSFFKTCRIDDLKLQIVELGIVDAPVARDVWQVIDQRQLAADEAIGSVDLPTLGRPTMATVKPMGEDNSRNQSGSAFNRNVETALFIYLDAHLVRKPLRNFSGCACFIMCFARQAR